MNVPVLVEIRCGLTVNPDQPLKATVQLHLCPESHVAADFPAALGALWQGRETSKMVTRTIPIVLRCPRSRRWPPYTVAGPCAKPRQTLFPLIHLKKLAQ